MGVWVNYNKVVPKKEIALKKDDILTFGVDILSKSENERLHLENLSYDLKCCDNDDNIIISSSDDEDENDIDDCITLSSDDDDNNVVNNVQPSIITNGNGQSSKMDQSILSDKLRVKRTKKVTFKIEENEIKNQFFRDEYTHRSPTQEEPPNAMPMVYIHSYPTPQTNDNDKTLPKPTAFQKNNRKHCAEDNKENIVSASTTLNGYHDITDSLQSPDSNSDSTSIIPSVDPFNAIISSIINWTCVYVKTTNYSINNLKLPECTFETYENYKNMNKQLIEATLFQLIKKNMVKFKEAFNLIVLGAERSNIGSLFKCKCKLNYNLYIYIYFFNLACVKNLPI